MNDSKGISSTPVLWHSGHLAGSHDAKGSTPVPEGHRPLLCVYTLLTSTTTYRRFSNY